MMGGRLIELRHFVAHAIELDGGAHEIQLM